MIDALPNGGAFVAQKTTLQKRLRLMQFSSHLIRNAKYPRKNYFRKANFPLVNVCKVKIMGNVAEKLAVDGGYSPR